MVLKPWICQRAASMRLQNDYCQLISDLVFGFPVRDIFWEISVLTRCCSIVLLVTLTAKYEIFLIPP